MKTSNKPARVLYSFPLKLGAGRVCTTAWYQVQGLAAAGAEVTVFPAAICKPVSPGVKVRPTLAWGRFRVPNRYLSRVVYGGLHDWIVSRRVEKLAGQIDIIHTWPVGALRTLKTAARLGIPTVLERCNAHTRFAYEVVKSECERLGVSLPPGHEHAWNEKILRREEAEYEAASRLLCPSDFVVKTFVERGFPGYKLLRHTYGFDERVFYSNGRTPNRTGPLTMLSVGVCAVRKGLHYALEAWLRSPASRNGTFLIAGEFVSAYAQKLSAMLAHPSIKVLGHRNDVAALMRQSDILVLPSIEEGSALVTSEARASGCVLLVSEAAGAICKHLENSLVHSVGDIRTLSEHIGMLYQDRGLLEKLRSASLATVSEATWNSAGLRLLGAYHKTIQSFRN